MNDPSTALSEDQEHLTVAKLVVVTVKKSVAPETFRWFRRNGSPVVDGSRGFLGFTMCLRAVSSHGAS